MKPHLTAQLSWTALATLLGAIFVALAESQVTVSHLVPNDHSGSHGNSIGQQFPQVLHVVPAPAIENQLRTRRQSAANAEGQLLLQKRRRAIKSFSNGSSESSGEGHAVAQSDVMLLDARLKRSAVSSGQDNSEASPAKNSPPEGAEPNQDTGKQIRTRQLSEIDVQAEDLEAAGQTQSLSYASPPGLLGGTLGGAFGGLGGVGGFGGGLGLGFGSALGNGLSSFPGAGSAGFFPDINIPLAGQPLLSFSPSLGNFGGLSLGGGGTGGFNSAPLPNFASQSFAGGLNLGSFGNANNFGSPKIPSVSTVLQEGTNAFLPAGAKANSNSFDVLRQLASNPYQSAFKASINDPTLSSNPFPKEDRLKELEKEVERDLDLSDKQLTPQQLTTKAIYESIEGILREPQVTTSQGLNGIRDSSTKSFQETTAFPEKTTKPSTVESLNYKAGGDLQEDAPSPPAIIPAHSSDTIDSKKQGHNFVSEDGFPIDKNSKLTPFEPRSHDIPQVTATLTPPNTITGYVTTGLPRISATEPVTVLPPPDIVDTYGGGGVETPEDVLPGVSDVIHDIYSDTDTNNDYESSLQSIEHTSQDSFIHHISESSVESRPKESPIRFEDRPIPIGRPRLKHPSFGGHRLQENKGRPPPFGIPDIPGDPTRGPFRPSHYRRPDPLSSVMHRNRHRDENDYPRNRPPFPDHIHAHQEDFQPFLHPVGITNHERENPKVKKPLNHLNTQGFETPSPKPGKQGSTPDPILYLHMGNKFPNSHQQRPEESPKNTPRTESENDYGIKLMSLPPPPPYVKHFESGHKGAVSSTKPPADKASRILTEFGLRPLPPPPKLELPKLLSSDEILSLIEHQNPNPKPKIDFDIGSSITDETIVHPDEFFPKRNKANGDDELILTNPSGELTEKPKYTAKESEVFSASAHESQESKKIAFDMNNRKFITPASHSTNSDKSKEQIQILVPSPPPVLSYPTISTTTNEIDITETSQPTKQPFIDIYDYQLDDTEIDSVKKTMQKLFVAKDPTTETVLYVKEFKAQQNNTDQIELPPTDNSPSTPSTLLGTIWSQPSLSETTPPQLQPSAVKVQISSPLHVDTPTSTLTPDEIKSYPQPDVTEIIDSLHIQGQDSKQGSLTLFGDALDSTHQLGVKVKHRGNTGIRSEQQNVDLYVTTEPLFHDKRDSSSDATSSEAYISTPNTQDIVTSRDSVVQTQNEYPRDHIDDEEEEINTERDGTLFREAVTGNILNPKQETVTFSDHEIYLSDASDNQPEEYISPTSNSPPLRHSFLTQEESQQKQHPPKLVNQNHSENDESNGYNTPQRDISSLAQLNYPPHVDGIPEYHRPNHPNSRGLPRRPSASVRQHLNRNSQQRIQTSSLQYPQHDLPRRPLSARNLPMSQHPSPARHLPRSQSPSARHPPRHFRENQPRQSTHIPTQSRGTHQISYNQNRALVPNRVNPLVNHPTISDSRTTEVHVQPNSGKVTITSGEQATTLSLIPHIYGDQQHSSSTTSATTSTLSHSPTITPGPQPVTPLENPVATSSSHSNQYQESLRAHESQDKPQNQSFSSSLEIPPLSSRTEDSPQDQVSFPAVTDKVTSTVISLQTLETPEFEDRPSDLSHATSQENYTTEKGTIKTTSRPSSENDNKATQEDIFTSDISTRASSLSFSTSEITEAISSLGLLFPSPATPSLVYSSPSLPLSSSTPSSLPTQVVPSVLHDDDTSLPKSDAPSSIPHLSLPSSLSTLSLSHSSSEIQTAAIPLDSTGSTKKESLGTETLGLLPSSTDSTVSVLSKPTALSLDTQDSNLPPSDSSESEFFIVGNNTPVTSRTSFRPSQGLENLPHHYFSSSEASTLKEDPITTPVPVTVSTVFPDLTTQSHATSPSSLVSPSEFPSTVVSLSLSNSSTTTYSESPNGNLRGPFQLVARHLRYTTASSPKVTSSYATTITTRSQPSPATTASSVNPDSFSPINTRLASKISSDSFVSNVNPEHLSSSSSSELSVTVPPPTTATKKTFPSVSSLTSNPSTYPSTSTTSVTESPLTGEDGKSSKDHLEPPLIRINSKQPSTHPLDQEHTPNPYTPVSTVGRRKPTPVVRRLSSKRFSVNAPNQSSTKQDVDVNRGVGRRPLPSAQHRRHSVRVAGFRTPATRS